MFDWTSETNERMLARTLELGIEAIAKELQEQVYLGGCTIETAILAAKNMLEFLQEVCQ
jgi:hypothetical protein